MGASKFLRALAVAGALALTACAAEPDPMRAATVVVSDGSGHGSGVIIAKNHVLTAAHVVAGEETLTIEFLDGKVAPATVLWANEDMDIALLQVETDGRDAAPLRCSPVRDDEKVFVVGAPRELRWAKTAGMVATINPVDGTKIALDVTLAPGSSGGPVFDRWGRVVGLADAILTARISLGIISVPTFTGYSIMAPATDACNLMGRA